MSVGIARLEKSNVFTIPCEGIKKLMEMEKEANQDNYVQVEIQVRGACIEANIDGICPKDGNQCVFFEGGVIEEQYDDDGDPLDGVEEIEGFVDSEDDD